MFVRHVFLPIQILEGGYIQWLAYVGPTIHGSVILIPSTSTKTEA